MTVAWGGTISSIEGNDWAMVYRDWVYTGGGIMHSWHFMFSVPPCHFCLLTGGKFEMVFFLFLNHVVFFLQTQFRVMVRGHLKWTPQRPCLGNEIALDMAFCHVPPLCILIICGTWRSAALKDSHRDTSLIRLTAHSLPLVSSVSFLLVFLLVCPSSLLLWRPNSHLILLQSCHFCFNFGKYHHFKKKERF